MEFNKIVGAILFTALSAMVISKIGDLLIPEEILAVHTTAPATTGPGPAKKPVETEPTIAQALAKADIKKGETIVKTRCVACHTWTKGGANKVGPNLWGIVGRPKGSHPGYDYSSAMKKAGGKWTYADIYKFLHNPQSEVKGTKMPFHLSKWQLRADVIAFLRTQNDNPPPLPKTTPAAKTAPAKKAEPKKTAPEETK
jgi:cytochrome c